MSHPTDAHREAVALALGVEPIDHPELQRAAIERLAQVVADAEAAAEADGYTRGRADALAGPQARAQADALDRRESEVRDYLARYARADPKLGVIATQLRQRNWVARVSYPCGCGPAGLCPTHIALRDAEAAAVAQ